MEYFAETLFPSCHCLTEMVAMLSMSAMTTVLFLGGWLSPLPFCAIHLGSRRHLVHDQDVDGGVDLFTFVKAIVPRYRWTFFMRLAVEGIFADLAVSRW